MKIAILSPFPPYRGGIAQFSQQLFNALEKTNSVKAFSFSRLYPKILFPGKNQFVENKKETMLTENFLDSLSPLSYYRTAKKIQQFAPEVLVIAYWSPLFIPCFGIIANFLKKKTTIIFLLHNAISHDSFILEKQLSTWLFKKGKGFILMSTKVKNDLLNLQPKSMYYQQPHPIYRHFGTKIEKFLSRKILNLSLNKKTLLFFGFIRPYKKLDLLLDAFYLLDDSYQLVIAGECYGSFNFYHKKIDSFPLKKNIRIENRYIPENEVSVFFSASDLLVLPYKSATQSGGIAMAYHFDLPILATDVGNFKESLETTGTGLVCKTNSLSLAKEIKKFFTLDYFSFVHAIQINKQHLSWETFADGLLSFSKKLKLSQKIKP